MEVANASLLDEGTAAAEAMAMIARAVNSKVGGGVKHGVFMSFPLKNHIKDTTCMVESLDWRFVFFRFCWIWRPRTNSLSATVCIPSPSTASRLEPSTLEWNWCLWCTRGNKRRQTWANRCYKFCQLHRRFMASRCHRIALILIHWSVSTGRKHDTW